MSIAHNPYSVSLLFSLFLPPDDTATCFLPGPNSVSAHLAERLAAAETVPAALVVVGLLRRDDTWPIAVSTLAAATSVLARSLRGDDWLGRSGPHEFAVMLSGSAADAEVAATRLTTAITGLGISGLGACAGVATLEPGTSAAETMRRAILSLQTARSRGAGQVIRYRSTR